MKPIISYTLTIYTWTIYTLTTYTLTIALVLTGSNAWAESDILSKIPGTPRSDTHYVFYLHGKISEGAGPRPNHPRFGIYEYEAILLALKERGYTVIAEQRKANTDVDTYAIDLATQINRLLSQAVPADRITVIGFSKGGRIAQAVSAKLESSIRYVLLASCPKSGQGPQLHGKVLSIREKSDPLVGSCNALFVGSPDIDEHKEVLIEIGGGHGAFYEPDKAWLRPLGEWIEG